MMSWLKGYFLYLAWLIAAIGFCVSVFYGEILGVSPCSLCWYQRMALFPLVVILGIAVYRGDRKVVPYVLPLVVIGGSIGIFQVLQRYFSFLHIPGICNLGVQCSNSWIQVFGFLDFPWVSSIGFILLFVLLILSMRSS